MGIPVINLEAGDTGLLRKVCKEHGFFYLDGHGVPLTLMDAVLAASRKLFDLPKEDKFGLLADANNRGYTPMEEETLDPLNQRKGDTKEGYYIGKEVPAGSPAASKPLHGPNKWPPPELLPGWRETMEEYLAAVRSVAMRLTLWLGDALGLPSNFFGAEGFFDDPMVFLRLLHYSDERSAPEDGVLGAGAHSDYGMLTLLLTDDIPGLQIYMGPRDDAQYKQGWIDVPPRRGLFVVNLGDMLERWSNGIFKSTLHRVVNISGRERYSIPFFFEPNFEAVVECLPTCCGPDNPPNLPILNNLPYEKQWRCLFSCLWLYNLSMGPCINQLIYPFTRLEAAHPAHQHLMSWIFTEVLTDLYAAMPPMRYQGVWPRIVVYIDDLFSVVINLVAFRRFCTVVTAKNVNHSLDNSSHGGQLIN
eukprot:jgi/Mesvir1/2289/Mv19327-RA.1